jgi:hypothetical protein
MNSFIKVKEGEYVYSGKCAITHKPYTTQKIKAEDLFKYNQGELIQKCFPYLSADDREFIMSGLAPEAFDALTKEDEDEA